MRVSLASRARIACPACRYDGPPPVAAAEHLARAEAVLFGSDARERQLSSVQRDAVSRALRWRTLHAVLLVAFGVPFVLWTAIGVYVAATAEEGGASVAGPIAVLPIVFYGLIGFLAFRVAAGARARLFASCAAGPPGAPGEPAECHVCGGPVAGTGLDPIARCAFCGTDNVIHPAALVTARGRRERDVATLERDVAARSAAVGTASFGAAAVALGSVVIAPIAALFVSLAGIVAVAWVFSEIGLEPLPHKYAFEKTRDGQCVARLHLHDGKPTLDLGGAPVDNWMPVPPGTTTFPAKALIGRRVVVPSTHQRGVVRSVFAHPLFALNSLVLDDGSKAPVQGSCLDEKK